MTMRIGQRFTGWLGLILLVWLASCGTGNVGDGGPDTVNDNRGGSGVMLNGFEVIRYNTDGYADSSLNHTITLRGTGQQSLVIAINDANYTSTVALDLRYNGQNIHPDSVEFHGLLGNDSQVLSAQFLGQPGVAGIGQTGISGYAPAELKGDFATVSFAPGALRSVSAPGSVHHNPDGVADTKATLPNLSSSSDTGNSTASVSFTAAWHTADGDQNKEVNIADITPIGAHFGDQVSSDWTALPADYDDNGEVNISDMTPIGLFFGEGTDSYTIEAADDTDGASRTAVIDLDFVASATPPDDPTNQAGTALSDVFKYWGVTFDGASAFTYAQLAALDTNANDTVRVFITPTRVVSGSGIGTGAESFVDLAVGEGGGDGPATLTITDFRIRVEGAAGGTGTNSDLFDTDNPAGTVTANSQVTVTLDSISGTYNSDAGTGSFDGGAGPFPSDMDAADYQTAFDAAKAEMGWDAGHNGAAGFRRTSDWLLLLSAATFPLNDDPGPGTVFPDDDPESDGSQFTEGTLAATLPQEGGGVTYPATADLDVNVLADVSRSFDFDVTVDDNAPTITEVQDVNGPLEEFTLQVDTSVTATVDWGAAGAPADLTLGRLQLLQFIPSSDPGDSSLVPDHIPVNDQDPFEFSLSEPPGSPPDEAGEYLVQDFGDIGVILCVVGGINLDAGANYHFRYNDGTTWCSVNKPEQMQTTAPPPPAQDLIVVPETIGTGRKAIQIFYPDPLIRRNPRVLIDILNQSADPVDQLAYDDVLKQNGDEFFIQIQTGLGFFPRITVVEAANPNGIDETTTGLPGVILVTSELQPNRICVDCQALPNPDQATPLRHFAFKLFDKNDLAVGQGTFDSAFLLPDVPNVVGVNWGVNAMNRVDADISTRDYTNHTADGSTIDGATPDVLWFEFTDGWMFDYDKAQPSDNNVAAYVTRISDDQIQSMRLDLRVAGVTSASTYIALHVLGDNDFASAPNIDGWPGILRGGEEYTMQLDDPTKPGIESTFVDTLFVSNDAPFPNPDL
jgi:hypothetical protein